MIVVAIIAILSAFAIPAYQDYTMRTYVTEGLALFGPFKEKLIDYYSISGNVPILLTDLGYSESDLTGQVYVSNYLPFKGHKMMGLKFQPGMPGNVFLYYDAYGKDNVQLELAISFYISSGGQMRFVCGDKAWSYNYIPNDALWKPSVIRIIDSRRKMPSKWQPVVCRI